MQQKYITQTHYPLPKNVVNFNTTICKAYICLIYNISQKTLYGNQTNELKLQYFICDSRLQTK